jgi:hypothetical protein
MEDRQRVFSQQDDMQDGIPKEEENIRYPKNMLGPHSTIGIDIALPSSINKMLGIILSSWWMPDDRTERRCVDHEVQVP